LLQQAAGVDRTLQAIISFACATTATYLARSLKSHNATPGGKLQNNLARGGSSYT
jgi:hypothetical protein